MTQPQTHEAMVISCVCVCAQASITRVSFQQSTAICPSIKISTSQPVSWSYLGCRAMDSRSCINWFFYDILLQLQLHERRFSHQSRRAANKSRVPRCLKHSKQAEQIWCFSASAKKLKSCLTATKMHAISPNIALNETYRFNVSASVFCQKSTSVATLLPQNRLCCDWHDNLQIVFPRSIML